MFFSRIAGQERAKKFLMEVMSREKIPHAYLFTGIPGVGKTTTAMALSLSLNCLHPDKGDGCGHCPPCRQMVGGNFPDFLSLKPDGQNLKIDQIRALKRRLGFSPLSGKYRVCVIHQAERMTEEAANSFLKTLEEPPPGNILVLNVTEPLDLLPTIVSRCQRVPFRPLPVPVMMAWLVEKKGLKQEESAVLAKLSEGSLGRALKMWDQDFLNKRQAWLLRLIDLPDLPRDKVLDMALDCVQKEKKGSVYMEEGGEPPIVDIMSVWESWYRDLLVARIGGPTDLLVNMDFSHRLQNMAERFSIKGLIESLLTLDQSRRSLRRNRNAALVMEHTVLSLRRLAERRN